ncbi:MAG: hypothetical protein GU352_03050 [Acidilobus sp.]|nr:hypothetical protein [Acidilobus sp.]
MAAKRKGVEALIFVVLAVILDFVLLGVIASLGVTSAPGVTSLNLGIPGPTLSFTNAPVGFAVAFSVIFLMIDFTVIAYAMRIYAAADRGDVATLKSYNSLGWAVAALIFWRYTWRAAPHSLREDRGSPKPPELTS